MLTTKEIKGLIEDQETRIWEVTAEFTAAKAGGKVQGDAERARWTARIAGLMGGLSELDSLLAVAEDRAPGHRGTSAPV